MVNEEDPNYDPDQLEVYDDTEAMINQLKMTLSTNKGEVLGEPNFGLDIHKYLFDFEVDPFKLSSEADSQIKKYVTLSKIYTISVNPAYIVDDRDHKIFVLNIGLDNTKRQLSILYDH